MTDEKFSKEQSGRVFVTGSLRVEDISTNLNIKDTSLAIQSIFSKLLFTS